MTPTLDYERLSDPILVRRAMELYFTNRVLTARVVRSAREGIA